LSGISSWRQSLDDDLALWADLGIDYVGLLTPKFEAPGWDASLKTVLDAGVRVSSIVSYFEEITEALDFTAAVGAPLLYVIPGGAGSVLYEEAADKFAEDTVPLVARARDLGLRLAIENTNPLRRQESFVYTVRDAVELGRRTGVDIVLDFCSSWYESGLQKLVRDNVDLLALVQICDYKIGTTETANRVAIGDGDIPVERLMGLVLDAGYEGPFDLEILGPRIEEEGYRSSILRSLERATEILDRLGA
jgi:sugar phosphate isomerase/epimerase